MRAYERHLEAEQHHIGKENTEKDQEHIHHSSDPDQAVRTPYDLLAQTARMHEFVIGLASIGLLPDDPFDLESIPWKRL